MFLFLNKIFSGRFQIFVPLGLQLFQSTSTGFRAFNWTKPVRVTASSHSHWSSLLFQLSQKAENTERPLNKAKPLLRGHYVHHGSCIHKLSVYLTEWYILACYDHWCWAAHVQHFESSVQQRAAPIHGDYHMNHIGVHSLF